MGVDSSTPIEQPLPPESPVKESGAESASSRALWVSLLAFVASLFTPVLIEFVTDLPWFLAVGISASIGAIALWNLNVRYERRLKDRTLWTRSSWLRQQIPLAMAGVLTAGIGAAFMRFGASTNNDWLVAVALGIVVGGVMVVIRVVEVDLGEVVGRGPVFPKRFSAAPDSAPDPLPIAAAWTLNVGLIGGATLFSMAAVAFSLRGLAIGLAVVLLWSTAVWAGRTRATRKWTAVGFTMLAVPIGGLLGMTFVGIEISGLVLYLGVVLMLVGIVIVSARQRSLWPEQDSGKSENSPLAIDQLDRRDLLLGIGGLLALVLGMYCWWRVVGAGPGVGLVLTVLGGFVVVLLGVSLVTRGEGFLAIALLGFALVWSVDGHTVGPQPAVSTDGDQPVMVAFGDSYMSGEGIGRFYDDTNTADARDYRVGGVNDCRRSPAAYTPLLANRLGFALSFDACSGAKAMSNELADELLPVSDEPMYLDDLDLSEEAIEDYLDAAEDLGEDGHNSIIGQLLRWLQVPPQDQPQPDVVLLSLGGNDAGFSGIGQACFMPGSCRDALNARSDDVFGRVTTRSAVALAAVATVFPDAELAVVAYPQMFGEATATCIGQVPFQDTEVLKLAETVEDLNAAVFAGVTAARDAFGDRINYLTSTSAAFDGHRFCEAPADRIDDDSVVNTVYLQAVDGPDLLARITPGKLIHNTFHPTTRGHELLADALCNDLGELRAELTGGATGIAGASCPAMAEPPEEEEPDELLAMTSMEAEADGDVCSDFDKYVYCSIVGWAQRVALPIILLVIGGAIAARWVDRNNLLLKLLAALRRNRRLRKLMNVIPIRD